MPRERWPSVDVSVALEGALTNLAPVADISETAAEWVGAYVYVHLDDALPLEKGQYYLFQIQGLEVRTADGEHLGRVVDILVTGANDVYLTDRVPIPAVDRFIRSIDLAAGRMVVEGIDELL